MSCGGQARYDAPVPRQSSLPDTFWIGANWREVFREHLRLCNSLAPHGPGIVGSVSRLFVAGVSVFIVSNPMERCLAQKERESDWTPASFLSILPR